MYRKDARTGVVLNVAGDYEQYLQQKRTIKAIKRQDNKLQEAKSEVRELKDELHTIKDMLQQLLDKKS